MEALKREKLGKKAGKLREEGVVPAVVYGRKFKTTPIQINLKDFIKKVEHSEAGLTSLISLKLKENGRAKTVPVLTKEIQRDPLTDEIIHIDFRHLIMDEEIETKVPVELIGIPIGVKDDGGVLISGLREVVVKCLPADIPERFEIDVSALKIGDSLHVSDLTQIKKVKVLTPQTEMIAGVSPPIKEEVVAPPIPTPEEVAAAEAAPAVTEEAIKEKVPPGAPPPEKPVKEEKTPKKEEKK